MKKILTPSLVALAIGIACTGACTVTTDDSGGTEGEGEGEGPLDLSNLDKDHTLSGDVTIEGDITVNNGATLTIEPGTTIRMGSGRWLRVEDGVLKADGTEDAPITIRGVDDGKARFLGVDLRSGTRSGTSLSFVTIDGGGEVGFGDRGCLSLVDVPADRVSLVDLTLQNCGQAGLRMTGEVPPLTAFDRITINNADVGMSISQRIAGEIDEGATTTGVLENRLLDDTNVEESYTLKTQNEAWHSIGDIDVSGPSAPVLTIEAGNTLRFEDTKWIAVGNNGPGGLVAVGTAEAPITFASVDTGASTKGAWLGVFLREATLSGTRLEFVTVEGGGQDQFSSRGCITIDGDIDNKVALTDVTLRQCGLAGLGIGDNMNPLSAFDRVSFDDCDRGIASGIEGYIGVTSTASYTATPSNRIIAASLDTDVTLVSQPVFANVEGDLIVRDAATLTIAAGNELRFNSNTYLNIDGGRLVADGTAEARVTLGATDAGSSGGAWLGVFFRDATLSGTRLTHTLVKQGGQDAFSSRAGINVIDSGPEVTLDNVTFSANNQADIFHTCDSAPTLVNTTGLVDNDCG